jgi:hypothetical protein
MSKAVKGGAPISMGIDHPGYQHVIDSVPEVARKSLAEDLD